MAIKLSNTGITSGSVIRAAAVSQSIDALTGEIAYDINISGSFTTTGSAILSGSVSLPGETHLGIGAPANVQNSIYVKAQDSTDDPIILLEGFDIADSATMGFKNADMRWNIGLFGGSSDSFLLQNLTTNTFPLLVDYSSSNGIVMRNDNGTQALQKVGINWEYGQMGILDTPHTLNISGSATASGGFYGQLNGTASKASEIYVASGIGNATNPILFKPGVGVDNFTPVMHDGTNLFYDTNTGLLNGTITQAQSATSSSYALTASYVQISTASQASTSSVISLPESRIPFGNSVGVSTNDSALNYNLSATMLHAPNATIDNNVSASSFSASRLDGVTSETIEGTFDSNTLFFSRNQATYLGNRNTGSDANLTVVVGGPSSVTYSALIINRHQELTFGNPGTSFDYPLGYAVGEFNSYAQFENNNNSSASCVAIKGASGADGILYLGGSNEYGGGILYHGSDLGSNIPSTFEESSTTIYRSSKSVAEPVIDFPTDNNHVMVRLDNTPVSNANLDYFGMGPVGSANLKPWRKTFMMDGITTAGATTAVLGRVAVGGVGTYSVKFTVGKTENQSPPSYFMQKEIVVNFFLDTVNGTPTPMIAGTSPSPTVFEATSGTINTTISVSAISTGFEFRSAASGGQNLVHNGFAEITFFPISVI